MKDFCITYDVSSCNEKDEFFRRAVSHLGSSHTKETPVTMGQILKLFGVYPVILAICALVKKGNPEAIAAEKYICSQLSENSFSDWAHHWCGDKNLCQQTDKMEKIIIKEFEE